MKHILTLATLVFATACFGQVPDHAPSNGLVAWWPLYGNVEDAFGSLHGVSVGGVAVDGPAGLEDRAIALPGEEDFIDLPTGEVNEEQGLTLAFWTWLDIPEGGNAPLVDRPDISNNIWSLDYQQSNQLVHFITRNDDGTGYHNLADWAPPQAQWCHVATVYRAQTGTKELHVNGALVSADNAPLEGFTMPTLRLGEVAEGTWNSNCRFSEVGLWQRDLGQDEIFGLYEAGLPIEGCTNEDACNFNPDAVVDNGTCASCEQLQTACLEGTVWSEQLGGCIVANVSDTDFDGCVGINDFLVHLSNFGSGCGPEPAWACGDPLEYQGYDYETVQIGEQCWFAENCRYLPYVNAPSDRSNTEAKYYVWQNTSTDVVVASTSEEYVERGTLYNHPAAMTTCPQGWKLPASEDFEGLSIISGGDEFAGTSLNSTNMGGDDIWEFQINRTGYLNDEGSWLAPNRANFWNASPDPLNSENALYRYTVENEPQFVEAGNRLRAGKAVRCLKE